MAATIYYITEQVNNVCWKLAENSGHEFERRIYNIIYEWCDEHYSEQFTCTQTPGSNDHGRDIVIESECNMKGLFFQHFEKKADKKLKIYMECKSSNSYKIDYNALSGNLKLSQNDNIDYYVLITNSTITPHTLYQLSSEAQERGFKFILIDQYILYRFLKEQNSFFGEYQPPQTEPQIHAEYQIFSEQNEGKNRFCIYLLIRNYTDSTQRINLQIKTDHNWVIEQNELPKILDSQQSICHLMTADKLYYDGLDELCLMIQSSAFEKTIAVKGINVSHNFIPPLCGEFHYEIIDTLLMDIKKSSSLKIYYIWGEAGVGKTRITEEIARRLNGTNIKCGFFICTLKGNIYQKIHNFLQKEKTLSVNPTEKTLVSLFKHCKILYKKYVIFIDDVHNENLEFFDDIRTLMEQEFDIPITIILLGRNDYSKGSPAYYSFIDQCNSQKFLMKGYTLKSLKDREARSLIQAIITDAPESVVEKIHKLSNNIPLYIVQFIQYLLDVKLVKIMNRSTVGIMNVEAFSSRTDLPQKIDDIYKNRIKNLKKLPNGSNLIEFLFMVSNIGIEFSKTIFLNFFDDDERLLGLLIDRYFLSYTNDGNLKFVHESLYLYFENYLKQNKAYRKNIAKKIWEYKSIFFHVMSDLDKGSICFWAGEYEQSLDYFKEVINDIRSIENYSSIHINSAYREYLDDIYALLCQKGYNEQYLKNTLFSKIYLTLHFFTPYLAIKECEKTEKLVGASKSIKSKEEFLLAIKEQKAHSYINIGQLKNGESLLQNLLSKMLYNPSSMDSKTKFDLYDKLTNINLKYNNLEIAQNYNQLAFRVAKEQADYKLMALAEISKAKIILFRDSDASQIAVAKAKEYLTKDNEKRITCHNNLSELVFPLREAIMTQDIPYSLVDDFRKLHFEAMNNNYSNSILRGYVFLATISLTYDLEKALEYVNHGIDASIRWGQANYMWHFYNLKAIIASRQKKDTEYISKLFETVYRLLSKQNLLFWGSLDFTYENILAMTNVMKFCHDYGFESDFYRKISSIHYNESIFTCDYNCGSKNCEFNCIQTTKKYKKEYSKIGKGHLLLVDTSFSYTITDEDTGYYLPFS